MGLASSRRAHHVLLTSAQHTKCVLGPSVERGRLGPSGRTGDFVCWDSHRAVSDVTRVTRETVVAPGDELLSTDVGVPLAWRLRTGLASRASRLIAPGVLTWTLSSSSAVLRFRRPMPSESSRTRFVSSCAAEASIQRRTLRPYAVSLARFWPTTTRRTLSGGLPPLVDPENAAREVFDAVAGFGPLQPYLDDPTVEEIWINEPGRVFVARERRSELTTHPADRRPGPRPGRADAEVQPAAGSTCPSPFVDATLPDGSRLHVVIPDVTRAHWSVNIRKFVVRADAPRRPRPARHADPTGRRLPRGGRRRRPQHRRRRRHPGRQDDAAQLPCSRPVPARERVVTCEEVFELKVPLRRRGRACRPASRASRAPARSALRRLVKEALRMRPSRHHRRRGAAGGVPRPAHRPQQRRPRHVHRARQLRARGGHQDVHAAAAGRRERRPRRSSSRPSPPASTSSCTWRLERDGARRVREIVGRARPGRGRRRRDRGPLHHVAMARSGAGRRLPAARRAVRESRLSTSASLLSLGRGLTMGALAGLLLGLGASSWRSPPGRGPSRAAERVRSPPPRGTDRAGGPRRA